MDFVHNKYVTLRCHQTEAEGGVQKIIIKTFVFYIDVIVLNVNALQYISHCKHLNIWRQHVKDAMANAADIVTNRE